MIERARFRNFKSLRDVEIPLERFTVLVGPNASGKSSVLQGLDLLCRGFAGTDGLEALRSRGAEEPAEISGLAGPEAFRVQGGAQGANGVRRGGPLETAHGLDGDWSPWQGSGTASPLPRSVLLRLEASKLVLPGPATDPAAMLPDGTGMHSALASLALNDPDSWQALQADLRRIVPPVGRLRHSRAVNGQPPALLFDAVGGDSLAAAQVSEGTLLVLGLLAALHGPDRPGLVLLDDMDRGLHPLAQVELVKLLRGLLGSRPDLQVVATTHSPYMLDSMQPNEVRLLCLKEDGSTACARLDAHPRHDRWKDELAAGEMWSVFGEKWVAAPRPQGVPA